MSALQITCPECISEAGLFWQAIFRTKDPKKAKVLHVMSSGVKAAATWSRAEIMQHCRECCGGQGFLAANKIGPMKNDMVGPPSHLLS